MPVSTSMIGYFRGVPKGPYRGNFMYAAQANYAHIAPMNPYIRNYKFYNKNVINTTASRWPWSH